MREEQTPVLVGVSQWVQREGEPQETPSPPELLAQLARRAAEDAGAPVGFLRSVDTVGVVPVAGWRPSNAPSAVAERIGARARSSLEPANGGEAPILLINRVAERIAAGRTRIAWLGGANLLATLRRAQGRGVQLSWPIGGPEGAPPAPDLERLGAARMGHDEREAAYGLDRPVHVYPLLENARRARLGIALEQHRRRLAALFAPFTRVAARNPYAWFPIERSAEELVAVSRRNRMIAFPYPKYLNAFLDTDQAAGVLLCSVAAARAHGIPEDRWVYWHGGANTEERAWLVSQRSDLGRSPALEECARRVLAAARVGIEDIDALDFYSCFPVAVEAACEAYGVSEDDPRGLTVTGGLPYAGGPGSNYAMHSVATMAERLRSSDARLGLTTGNGWYLTKHAGCVWSTRPPEAAVGIPLEAPVEVGPEPVALREVSAERGRVLAYTVVYDREGAPARGIVVGRHEQGSHFLANTPDDRSLLEAFVAVEQVGAVGKLRSEAGRLRFVPT